jgi:hypothetical protein
MRSDERLFIWTAEKFLRQPLPNTSGECQNHFIEGSAFLDFSEKIQPNGWLYLERERLGKVKSCLQDRLHKLEEKQLRLTKPSRPFIGRNNHLKGKWKEHKIAVRTYLKQDGVIKILNKLKSHEDRIFVIFVLEPAIHSITEDDTEMTFCKWERIESNVHKTGRKDPERINKIIVLLAIHLKKCLGSEHYALIAHLLNCLESRQGKEKLTERSIRQKLYRFRKSKDWNQEQWESRYHFERRSCQFVTSENGLSQLVSKITGNTDTTVESKERRRTVRICHFL